METQETPDNQKILNRMNYAWGIIIHDAES